MVMSSHQISALAMNQQAMFGNVANYAQQITPLGGMGPGMGMPYTGGYSMGAAMGHTPPAMAPMGGLGTMGMMAMHGAPGSGMQQAFAEQALGTGLSGLAGMAGGISNLAGGAAGLAGMASFGAGGIGAIGGLMSGAGMAAGWGAGTAALGSIPYLGGAAALAGGLPFAAGAGLLAAGAGAANEVYGGFQQRQGVNRVLRQRFGGMMGVGGGAGGTGFNAREMGGISTMVREMSGNDMFTQFDELTRVMDRTSQMGMYRGVQSAREFREKFRKTVDTLKEIATTMHTSLEGATQFMEQQRNMGFFSGQDINKSLMQTRLTAGATGMTTQQLAEVGQMGAQQGRAMGMLGRSGAEAAQRMAGNVAMAMRMGSVSDEMIAEATGGLTGAQGAQAFSGRMMNVTNRFLSRGAGRALLAGLWDPESGGVSQDLLRTAAGGGLTFREALRRGRSNIRETGGRRSEFFAQEERIRGRLLSSGAGPEVVMGMLGQHMERARGMSLEDPIMQRWVRRRLKVSQSEVELMSKMTRELPSILQAQRVRFGQQLEQEGVTRAREGAGIQGFRNKLAQVWERDVLNPLRQSGDQLTTIFSEAVEGAVGELEGRISTRMTVVGKKMALEIARTGKSSLQTRGVGGGQFEQYIRTHPGAGGEGILADVGRALGMRGGDVRGELAAMGATYGGTDREGMLAYRDNLRKASEFSMSDLNLSATDSARMQRQLSELIVNNPTEAGRFTPNAVEEVLGWGPGGFMRAGGGREDVRQNRLYEMRSKRMSFLLAKSPELARVTRDMNHLQKLEFVSKMTRAQLEGTSFDIDQYVTGGAGDVFGRSLREIKSFREAKVAALQGLVGAGGGTGEALTRTAGTIGGWIGGGGLVGSLLGATGLAGGNIEKELRERVSGDVGGLLDAAREDPALYRAIQGLAGQGPMSKEDAMTALRFAAEGKKLGVGLSEGQRRAALALAEKASTDSEATSDLLNQVLHADTEKARSLMMRPLRKRAAKVASYIDENRATFEEQLSEGTRGALDTFLKIQSDPKSGLWQVSEARRKLLENLGGTKEGQAAAALLGRSVSGRPLAADIEMTGAIFRRMKGMRGSRRQVEFYMGDMLGKEGRGLLGRRELGQLEAGTFDVEGFMEQLREESGGALTTEELGGRTEKEFMTELQRRADVAKGGLSTQEQKTFAAKLASEQGRRLQIEGQRTEERDLPALAKKQLQHLGNMEKILGAIAKKGFNVNVSVDKEGNAEIESPSGEQND
jgi:hypothetical protein